VKRNATLVESSELDRNEAELSHHGRNRSAGIGVVARHEDDLLRRCCIRTELSRRKVIERLDQARAEKRFGDDIGRQTTVKFVRSGMERIGDVDDELALPIVELTGDGLVSGKGNGEKTISASQASASERGTTFGPSC